MGQSFGDILLMAGIAVTAVGGLGIIIGNIIYTVKKKKLREKLFDEYGF